MICWRRGTRQPLRHGAQATGGDAAVNALAAALAARTTEVERMAVRLVEEKDGVMQ